VLDTGDEVDLREEAAQSQDNGGADDSSKKADNFIVSLHGLPYSATLDDIANFLEGLNVYCGSGKCRFIFLGSLYGVSSAEMANISFVYLLLTIYFVCYAQGAYSHVCMLL